MSNDWLKDGYSGKNKAHRSNVKLIKEKFACKYSFTNIYNQQIVLSKKQKIKELNAHDTWLVEAMQQGHNQPPVIIK